MDRGGVCLLHATSLELLEERLRDARVDAVHKVGVPGLAVSVALLLDARLACVVGVERDGAVRHAVLLHPSHRVVRLIVRH